MLEAAAIFAVVRVRAVRAALIVAVSDELFEAWNPGFDYPSCLEALAQAADIALDASGGEITPART